MDKADFNKLLGNNVKKRRLELGLTQEEVAVKVGYTDKGSVSKIEKGKVDVPLSKLSPFAEVLDCSVASLIGIDKEERLSRNLSAELGYQDVQLLSKFYSLTPNRRAIVNQIIDDLIDPDKPVLSPHLDSEFDIN